MTPEEKQAYEDQVRTAEALSYLALGRIIEIFQMEALFDLKVPKLKLMFYQFDRLIAIHLPDLHLHFKEEQVGSTLFSSSFFITIFTSHL